MKKRKTVERYEKVIELCRQRNCRLDAKINNIINEIVSVVTPDENGIRYFYSDSIDSKKLRVYKLFKNVSGEYSINYKDLYTNESRNLKLIKIIKPIEYQLGNVYRHLIKCRNSDVKEFFEYKQFKIIKENIQRKYSQDDNFQNESVSVKLKICDNTYRLGVNKNGNYVDVMWLGNGEEHFIDSSDMKTSFID